MTVFHPISPLTVASNQVEDLFIVCKYHNLQKHNLTGNNISQNNMMDSKPTGICKEMMNVNSIDTNVNYRSNSQNIDITWGLVEWKETNCY